MRICIVIPYNLLEWHHGNAIRVMNLVKYLSTHHELYLLMYDQFNKRRRLKAKNITSEFIKYLKEDRVRLEGRRESFLERFDHDDYDYLMDRWQGKINMCEAGELQWGLFVGDRT